MHLADTATRSFMAVAFIIVVKARPANNRTAVVQFVVMFP